MLQDQYKYRNELLKKYIFLATITSILLSPIYYYLLLPYLGLTLNIFSLMMFYLIKSSKDAQKFVFNSRLFMVSITILFLIFLLNGDQEINSTFFLLLFPIASFSIRGPKEGIVWSFLLLLTFIVLYTNQLLEYNPYSFLFFCVAFVMVSYLLYFYRHYEILNFRNINKELENTIAKRTAELKESNEKLKMLASTDPLTKLYNRAKLDEYLTSEVNRANRFNHHLAIVLLDIDHFKSVNDTFGHNIGDSLLIEFSNLLKKHTRDTDIVGRWGGEEFLVICPETDKQGVIKLAKNLKAVIEKNSFKTVGNKTASFGVTIYKTDEEIITFISRADEALYKAKENGRNKVEFL